MVSLLWSLAGLWVLLAAHDLRAVWRLQRLPQRRPDGPMTAVTAVMAVRDDGEHVEQSVTHLLGQHYVDLRVTVVDDRSEDDTGAVLARLAARNDRLRVATVRELPPDWLGKSHALHVGAANVTTPWLLFTDGDARLAPDALARAIDAAAAAGAHHVALLPTHRHTTLCGQACLLAFQLTILRRVAAVNGTHQRSFVGTGAFNLVRTDAWRAIGGHVPLRLEVVDDVWLGCLLQRAGFRSRVWLAADELAIDWGGTPRQLLRVTAKNMFAVLRYRTWLAMLAVGVTSALLGTTLLAPFVAWPLGGVTLAAYLLSAVPGMALARRMRWPVLAGALVPFGRFLLPVALANSTWTTLRQRGVRWRGTFYPLAQLRAGQVH